MKLPFNELLLLLLSQITTSYDLNKRAQELDSVGKKLQEGQYLILDQPCGKHPDWYKDTPISYLLEDDGDMSVLIGRDKTLACSVIPLEDIRGYEVKDSDESTILKRKWL